MNKLLSANFVRLKKDTFFWVCMVFIAATGIILPASTYMTMKRWDLSVPLDSGFFDSIVLVVILFPAFSSLFIGTEYNDGTIRNKLIVGHKRADIYLSNLIICIIAGFMMLIAYSIPYLCVGIPLLGFFRTDIRTIWGFAGCIFVLSIAFATLFTLVGMLNQNKAIAAVICILGTFSLIFIGSYINSTLGEPEYYDYGMYIYADPETGEIIEDSGGRELNPRYLRGAKRQVYEFLDDFLPGSQVVQLSEMSARHPGLMSVYSGCIAVAATGLGIFFFRREDIK